MKTIVDLRAACEAALEWGDANGDPIPDAGLLAQLQDALKGVEP